MIGLRSQRGCGPRRTPPAVLTPSPSGRRIRLEGAAKQALETGRTRLLVAAALFSLAFAVIGLRLVDVALLTQGNEPRLAEAPGPTALRPGRADIVDRNGVLLATSLATASLYANPRQVLDPERAAARLVQVLPELDRAEVAGRLGSGRSFVWLRRNLTPRQQYDVNRLGIPGLYFQREERRVYPHGALTAHVVGFSDIDNRGLSGIERAFDEVLRRADAPLRLSLDICVQEILRAETARAMDEFRAVGAAGLVLDARTGEVLAMVSLPDFDPNRPGEAGPDARFNRATLGLYEMGSTFKVFTFAMALESDVVSLEDGYDASRPIQVARYTIRDFKPERRWLSVPEIFIHSSNIGAAKMALDVGTDVQRDFLARLGLLRPATIELPEVGTPLAPSPWRDINTMTIGFGHGLAVSPLQLANGVAAVVNGGVLHPATLLERPAGSPLPERRVVSRRTSQEMRWLMRLVVERGTGKHAVVPGYFVGGKTGSAEKSGKDGYRNGALVSSFVGAFPINDPRYVVLVLLDEPQGNTDTFGYATGGWVAAPAVGRVIAQIGPLLGLPPVDEAAPELRRAMFMNVDSRGRKLASYRND